MANSFLDTQTTFTNFVRNPEKNPIPGDVKPERMLMYRELLFNNVNSFLTSNFPVLHKILEPVHWLELVQDFFSQHHCDTPYFSEIPEEFINYLQDERNVTEIDPPFMVELAHYEWVEMALSIAKHELPADTAEFLNNPLQAPLYLSPLAWPLLYQYPVHRLSPEFQPFEAPEAPTYLVVYRDAGDDVHFSEINAVTMRLLELIQQQPGLDAEQYLRQLSEECKTTDQAAFFRYGQEFIKEMVQKAIICGVQNTEA